MSKKGKLLQRLLSYPNDFTWEEAVNLMKQHHFELLKNDGSRRVFRHKNSIKVSIHEPHPQNILKKYAMRNLIDGLRSAGEIDETDA